MDFAPYRQSDLLSAFAVEKLPFARLPMKNKNVAGILALLVGIFGTHRFYLGQRFIGVLYFFAFWAGLGLTIEEGNPILMLLPALISLVDGIVFFAMPWEDFDRRYNKTYLKQQQAIAAEERSFSVPVEEAPPRVSKFEHHKREGIRKFRSHDFAGAVADFLEALTIRPSPTASRTFKKYANTPRWPTCVRNLNSPNIPAMTTLHRRRRRRLPHPPTSRK
jgi:hypothetical protein